MLQTLKDQSYEFSETAVKHEVHKSGERQETVSEIEFTLTFSFGFMEYSHDFVWLNEDVDTLLLQIEKIGNGKSGTLGVLSPGISFAYERYEHEPELFFFTVLMDTGYVNSYMGTDSSLGITLRVSLSEISDWIGSLLKE